MATITGYATSEGTARYASSFPEHQAMGFYRRTSSDWTVSTLGIGSYLGEMDRASDQNYESAFATALRSGINFLDTSLNYRHQRSERNLGAAIAHSGVARDGIVVCTKAGYLVPGAVPTDRIDPSDLVANMHCLAPSFLEDQLHRSLSNLGLDCIDVFYLHNPETQIGQVEPEVFEDRIRMAFEKLESLADQGIIRYYGAATWNGFRQTSGGLSIHRMAAVASALRGETGHRFRFIQLPFNLAMTEALSHRDENGHNIFDHAHSLGITVVASASILQGRLSRGLPPVITERLHGLQSDAQRAIQFTRSTPGITVALAGMGRPSHVIENLQLAAVPPATEDEYLNLFR
jgi:aryl-alcohol dehydrogenase-like predicted oxidoreductase